MNSTSGNSERHFNNAFHTMIDLISGDKCGHAFSVAELAEIVSIDKRRIYDLFNVLSALGYATRHMDKTLTWNGSEGMAKTLVRELSGYELRSYKEPIRTLFLMAEPPQIGALSLTIVAIYCFYGQRQMSLQEINLLLSSNKSRIQKFKRRLYLAAFFLENLRIIERTGKAGTYRLLIDPAMLYRRTLLHLQKRKLLPVYSYFTYLKNISNEHVMALYRQRQRYIRY